MKAVCPFRDENQLVLSEQRASLLLQHPAGCPVNIRTSCIVLHRAASGQARLVLQVALLVGVDVDICVPAAVVPVAVRKGIAGLQGAAGAAAGADGDVWQRLQDVPLVVHIVQDVALDPSPCGEGPARSARAE